VQQGMNGARRQARRYHWLWDRAGAFVDEPHAAIEGRPVGDIVNLVDRRAADARGEMIGLARGGPEAAVGGLTKLRMPAHHDVRAEDIDLGRLGKTLAAVAARGPEDFAELMLVPGVGARTLFALALVAEVVHGAPSRFGDPARLAPRGSTRRSGAMPRFARGIGKPYRRSLSSGLGFTTSPVPFPAALPATAPTAAPAAMPTGPPAAPIAAPAAAPPPAPTPSARWW